MKKKTVNRPSAIVVLTIAVSLAPFLAGISYSNEYNIIQDSHFQNGFDVFPPRAYYPEGTLSFDFSAGEPVWALKQWFSRESIINALWRVTEEGWCNLTNRYKELGVGPFSDSEDQPDLVLTVNSIEEYGEVYRSCDEKWPHLLVEQKFKLRGSIEDDPLSLNALSEINFQIDVCLGEDQRVKKAGYNAGLHAAQFTIFFTVEYRENPASRKYDDHLWLGIPIYDDRNTMNPPSCKHDVSTNSFIYSTGLNPFTEEGFDILQWNRVEGDLLPHTIDALEAAWSRGYLPDSMDLNDYTIGSLVLGWEVPGLHLVSMKIKNIRLTVSRKDDHVIDPPDPAESMNSGCWINSLIGAE